MMLRSDQWEETSNSDKLFNFKWLPFSRGVQYSQMNAFGVKQLVNHINGHEHLTTKDKLFENYTFHCETIKQDVFQSLPIQFTLQMDNNQCYQEFHKFLQLFTAIDREALQDVNTKQIVLPA